MFMPKDVTTSYASPGTRLYSPASVNECVVGQGRRRQHILYEVIRFRLTATNRRWHSWPGFNGLTYTPCACSCVPFCGVADPR